MHLSSDKPISTSSAFPGFRPTKAHSDRLSGACHNCDWGSRTRQSNTIYCFLFTSHRPLGTSKSLLTSYLISSLTSSLFPPYQQSPQVSFWFSETQQVTSNNSVLPTSSSHLRKTTPKSLQNPTSISIHNLAPLLFSIPPLNPISVATLLPLYPLTVYLHISLSHRSTRHILIHLSAYRGSSAALS